MNNFTKSILASVILGASTLAHARTSVYNMEAISPRPGVIVYPGLDLNNIKTATITVNREYGEIAELRSLEIIFANAGKLRASNFKRTPDGRYRTLVSGAWVFKEVIVEVDANPEFQANQLTNIQIFVTETTSILHPEAMNQGPPLAGAFGPIRDVTPLTTVDTATGTLDGKRINFNLKDRPGMSTTNGQQGFIIDTLWMGKGQKLMYIPGPFGPYEWDRIEAIGLTLEGTANDPLIRVRYKESNGPENSTPPIPLRDLLQTTFSAP